MKRAAKVIGGILLLLVGVVLSLPGIPGPGIAVIILGLMLLSDHFEWARRLLEYAKRKTESVRSRVFSRDRSV